MDPNRILLQEGSLYACCRLSTDLFADLHGRPGREITPIVGTAQSCHVRRRWLLMIKLSYRIRCAEYLEPSSRHFLSILPSPKLPLKFRVQRLP
jgi:hypothetical protein